MVKQESKAMFLEGLVLVDGRLWCSILHCVSKMFHLSDCVEGINSTSWELIKCIRPGHLSNHRCLPGLGLDA